MSDFFRTKNGFKKCILSQIELIRHWNKKTKFITTCVNFKLELTEHIRNRNSIFVGLVYTLIKITLRELIFVGINFHEFLNFLTISQKLAPAKIIGDCASLEIREN